MKGNTQEDIMKTDVFNEYMINKGLFILDVQGNVVMNPSPVMIGIDGAKFEYTMSQALRDFKTNK